MVETVAVRRLALLSPCSDCRCDGFRPFVEGAPPTYEKRTGLFYFDLSVYDKFSPLEKCSACPHNLRNHTHSVLQMNEADRNYYSQMVLDAYRLYGLIGKQKIKERVKLMLCLYETFMITLRKATATSERIIPYKNFGIEPFVAPNASQIVGMFMAQISKKYGKQKGETKIKAFFDGATALMSALNNWIPPEPENFNYNTNPAFDKTTYRLFYHQWYIRVFLPQRFPSLTQYELPELVGVESLLSFLRYFLMSYNDIKKRKRNKKAVHQIFIIATMLHEHKEQLRAMAANAAYKEGFEAPVLKFRRHIEKRKHNKDLKIAAAICKKEAELKNGHQFTHKEMLGLLARIVELERGEMFGEEDKFSVDLAKAEIVKEEIESGHVRFLFLQNQMSPKQCNEELIWLIQLKSLYNAQLPKMGVDYITRLVMDPKHMSLALIRNCVVIGGCTFRPFVDRNFFEIVFLAVNSHDQIKGYGTYLMNLIKDFAVKKGVTMFLTYADEFATGYFKKQGFTATIDMPTESYSGYIKDYEGATLMQCSLHPAIRYVSFAAYIKGVRDMHQALNEMLNPLRSQVYDGIEDLFDILESNTKKNNDDSDEGQEENEEEEEQQEKMIPWDSIPGLRHFYINDVESPQNIQKRVKIIIEKMRQHEYAWPFLLPVTEEDCPEYAQYVKWPSDLQSMERKYLRGYYKHHRLFAADVVRMFSNCYSFNPPDSEYYQCGLALNQYTCALFDTFLPKSEVYPHLPGEKEMQRHARLRTKHLRHKK